MKYIALILVSISSFGCSVEPLEDRYVSGFYLPQGKHAPEVKYEPIPPVNVCVKCPDVADGADLANLCPGSDILFGNMVSKICGSWNFITKTWYGGQCTAECSSAGDWCDNYANGIVGINASTVCDDCAAAKCIDVLLACDADNPLP